MALQIPIAHPSGVEMTYWRVLAANVGLESVHLEVGGYLSEEKRRAGCAPLAALAKDLSPDNPLDAEIIAAYFGEEQLKTEGHSPRERAYTWLKTLPEFAGALDV